ncbi:10318_t:CDS:1, partial [Dentiscutata erythropus]
FMGSESYWCRCSWNCRYVVSITGDSTLRAFIVVTGVVVSRAASIAVSATATFVVFGIFVTGVLFVSLR